MYFFFLNTKKQEPRNETDVSKDGKEAKLEIMTEVPYPGLLNTQRYKSRREKKKRKKTREQSESTRRDPVDSRVSERDPKKKVFAREKATEKKLV